MAVWGDTLILTPTTQVTEKKPKKFCSGLMMLLFLLLFKLAHECECKDTKQCLRNGNQDLDGQSKVSTRVKRFSRSLLTKKENTFIQLLANNKRKNQRNNGLSRNRTFVVAVVVCLSANYACLIGRNFFFVKKKRKIKREPKLDKQKIQRIVQFERKNCFKKNFK